MAFGLTNAPATFQRLMEGAQFKECLLFLDDILIFSESIDKHLSRLDAVFNRLNKHGLKLKPPKCDCFKSGVIYLDHILTCIQRFDDLYTMKHGCR